MVNKQGTNFIYTDERQRKIEKKRSKAEKQQATTSYWLKHYSVIDQFIFIIPNIGVISTHQNKLYTFSGSRLLYIFNVFFFIAWIDFSTFVGLKHPHSSCAARRHYFSFWLAYVVANLVELLSPSIQIDEIKHVVAIVWMATLSAYGGALILVRSALVVLRIFKWNVVLRFVIFTCFSLLASRVDLFDLAVSATNFKLATCGTFFALDQGSGVGTFGPVAGVASPTRNTTGVSGLWHRRCKIDLVTIAATVDSGVPTPRCLILLLACSSCAIAACLVACHLLIGIVDKGFPVAH